MRRARRRDFAAISDLERQVWKKMAVAPLDLETRFRLFPQGFQVARAGNQIVGFCSAVLTDSDAGKTSLDESFPPEHVPRGSYYYLCGLTVAPPFRHRGIGSALIQKELQVARRLGCVKVQLIANANSASIFEKAGFSESAPQPHLFREFPQLMRNPVLMELVVTKGD